MRSWGLAGLVLGAIALCCGLQAVVELRGWGAEGLRSSLLQYSVPTTYILPKDEGAGPAASSAAKKLALNLKKFDQKQKQAKLSHHMRYPFGYMHDQPEMEYNVHPQRQEKMARAMPSAPQPQIKALPLPAGYHVLKPGQKLPKGAKVIEMEPVALPAGTAGGAQVLRQFAHPEVGRGTQILTPEEGPEGDAEGEEGAEGEEDEARVANVTVPEPTIEERIDFAHEQHRLARVEKIKARQLKVQAGNLQKDSVMLIDQGWKNHQVAEDKINDANKRMEAADKMNANANKILELANAHTNEELASKMEEISADLAAAAEEKAADSKDYQDQADEAQAAIDEAANGEEGAGDGSGAAEAS